MSGPKSYTPPPRYSIKVFDGRLNEIFCLQSDIIQMFKELNKFSVNDNERNIKFNCDDFIKKNQNELNKQIKNFVVEYKGKFGQDKYDEFKNKIDSRAKSLNKFLNKLKKTKTEFLEKREDYKSYISYEKYYENSLKSLKNFKTNVIDYIEKNTDDKLKKKFEKTNTKIEQFEPKFKKINFEFGFQDIEKSNKEKVSKYITQSENNLGDLKNKIVKSILSESLSQKKQIITPPQKTDKKLLKKIESLTLKINKKIELLDDNKLKKRFNKELNSLKKSEVFKDIYFYKEFYDNIKKSEKTQDFRNKLKDVIYEINYTETATALSEEKKSLLETAINLLDSETIKQLNFNDFKSRYYFYKEKNSKEIQEEFIKKEENEFLKAQLVKGLENMNYDVIDDMEVIDFEKQSDFLMKVPNQKNYINLRIGKDNSIAYNFLTEESKDDLSIDQKRKKVVEMESTCEKFKQVLKDLEKMGLKLNQIKDTGASEETIMQIPKKYRDKIKKDEKRKIQQQVKKKKYLS